MSANKKEIPETASARLEAMKDNIMLSELKVVQDCTNQDLTMFKNINNANTILNNVMLLKVNALDDEVVKLNDRVTKLEQVRPVREQEEYASIFVCEEEGRKSNAKRTGNADEKNTLQECKKIVERAIEILEEWCEIQDIKAQVQYAAIVIGKIENIKKKEFIQSDEIRKKICTLLRNVIRLNFTDAVFTREQVLLLKDGFTLLVSDNVQKEDMLRLNREFRKKNLMTMPAWE